MDFPDSQYERDKAVMRPMLLRHGFRQLVVMLLELRGWYLHLSGAGGVRGYFTHREKDAGPKTLGAAVDDQARAEAELTTRWDA